MTRTTDIHADERGATSIEYSLVAVLIAIAIIGAMTRMAGTTVSMWNGVANVVGGAS